MAIFNSAQRAGPSLDFVLKSAISVGNINKAESRR